MSPLLRALADKIWPIHAASNPGLREAILKRALLLALAVLCGSEIIAFMELSTLLDLLGATLFLLSFAAGGRLMLAQVAEAIRRVLLPPGYVTIVTTRKPPSFRLYGALPFAINALSWFVLLMLPWVCLEGVPSLWRS